MKLNTKYHGTIEYEKKDIIHLEKGILGFENLKKFILFPAVDNDFFSIIHSIEDKDIGFVVTSPFEILKSYELSLKDSIIKKLKISKEDDVLILNIVTLNSEIENITVNLKAPIIINVKEKLGEQIVLDNNKYSIKHPLI
ncbi:flagellar assembly protein FliW [Clostridium oceanicum]|uniref:Flagellar assembly factor FliW n=1 Tax=Clostridium oceanicum TaxID=1543 RepID=A0ABN1JTU4_9CLOT